MIVLTCLLTRRRIGAYLDGALEDGSAKSVAAHLSGCTRCQGEAENIRRIRALLHRTLSLGQNRAEPADWSGFWPGVVRGIEDAKHRGAPAPVPVPRSWWWRPRLTLGGALVAAVLATVTLWQLTSGPLAPEAPIFVSSALTDDPRATVVVYSPHEQQDVAVVWVLGLDDSSD
jgi:anti-sigma factor RsiW